MNKFSAKENQGGFSLIEILMVLILIAVLAAIAINAFINFRKEASEAALRADLKVMRTSIAAQYSQMQMRCGQTAGTFPPLVNITANDITNGAAQTPCTNAQVAISSERQFVQGGIPIPPFNTVNTVTACAGAGCGQAIPRTTSCDGTGTILKTWCYDAATGDFWFDSNVTDITGTSYWNY